ncbi:MAG: hypothetical protein A2383_03155 [Candidatus Pacebacteria bacterium RIFOXYB1_FULL_39_46]|nr:MAG: hypothetical protein A2182_01200 [Candidatus Pacebacteria bacterium RIFOXYA1_FULL_38_18]OGJ38420.1 MAG: hypothetical protein A2383_03155 [Candidatus Pacebacteria bacterium RIFOXYB1_FULL_39_46]OGJ40281.1 MAG: hypothetical protein A2411_03300 [Candidatus Pacebacteria bacterium RIFOXYC1_FULL_39_21]OGJ40853.1 MAG: hypothetical protein A2582_02035 [Candidatus Pacebacteria bacterium RIFOXYD1_FULL_39_27]
MQKISLICAGCITDQIGNQFSLWQGLREIHQQQIMTAVKNDPLLAKFTSDPQRFSTLQKLKTWLAGPRIIYILTPKEKPNELSGLVWFSHELLSVENLITDSLLLIEPSHWTLGIRLYQNARGKRLSLPLLKKTFAHFWQTNSKENVWLSTASGNSVAQKIYQQFGFEFLGKKENRFFYLKKPN